MRKSKYSDEIINLAQSFYLKRWTPQEIAAELKLNSTRIVYYWADKFGWRNLLSEESLESIIQRRAALLTEKNNKTELELKELDKYIDMHVKIVISRHKHDEKIHAMNLDAQGGRTSSGKASKVKSQDDDGKSTGPRRKRNDVSGITADDFKEFTDQLFDYQRTLREAKQYRNRIWLKSRQIGATWYAAFEALEDAIMTGNNQAFLSASLSQSLIFRRYIVKFAFELFGLELVGDPIVLSNGAELHFLSTNSSTAQGFCANVYIDEIFWQRDFTRLKTVAAAIATHSYLRRTYISTPSAKTHQAYLFWTGDEWRKGKKARQDIEFPSFEEMQGGIMCPDNHWRFITTIEDAVRGGADILLDIEELQEENGHDAFLQLYMCQFIDSGDSVFRFDLLEKCRADVTTWQDHDINAARPFGNREVWAGYDPSRSKDTAAFAIVAPPAADGEPFRVLHIETWHGLNFKYQAARIKEYTQRYHITYIGVDTSGIGQGVFEMVQEFARCESVSIKYSVATKNKLVMKMIDTVENNRIRWDAMDKGISASFMAIRRTTTASGNEMTFVADRSDATGHADKFFAIAHALVKEPLNYERKRQSGWAKRLNRTPNYEQT